MHAVKENASSIAFAPVTAMKNAIAILTLLLAACAGSSTTTTSTTPTPTTGPAMSRVVGYYYGPTVRRGFPVSNIRCELLTHINYAFGEVNADGTVAIANPSFDTTNFAALRTLKQRCPDLKVLIAFGGWGGSKYFSDAASTPEMRGRFAQSVIEKFLQPYPGVFDGVDIDWEYPVGGGQQGNINRPEDKQNQTTLVEELRRRLDEFAGASKKHYLITIAAPAGPAQLQKFEMQRLGELLDFINVMTYDYHTGGNTAHFNAPLASGSDDPSPNLNIVKTIDAFLNAGVPANKLSLGIPFYGYGYSEVRADAAGRFQPIDRPTTTDSAARRYTGPLRYYQIVKAPAEGFESHWDETARVPWLYNPTTKTWITYDDPRSIAEKIAYARSRGLGGVMVWELSGDDGTLLPAINRAAR